MTFARHDDDGVSNGLRTSSSYRSLCPPYEETRNAPIRSYTVGQAVHAYYHSLHSCHGLTSWEARSVAKVAARLQAEKRCLTLTENTGCDEALVTEGDVMYRRFYTGWPKTDPRYVGPFELVALFP